MPKVNIENNNGSIRLRWSHSGKTVRLSLGMVHSAQNLPYATRLASQIAADIEHGAYDATLIKYRPEIGGKNATVISAPELFERFTLAVSKKKGLQPGSLQRYQGCQSHVLKKLNVPTPSVTASSTQKFVSQLLTEVSDRTAKEYLWMLAGCWDWAADKYKTDGNPWRQHLETITPTPRQRAEPFSVAEVAAIISEVETNRYYRHYAPLVKFLFGTGVRFGEAAGLRWSAVSLEISPNCWVGASVSRGNEKGTKTGKARRIVLSPSMQNLLSTLKSERNPQPDDLVFPSKTGQYLNDHDFNRRAWKSVLAAAGVPYRRAYTTRHTAISHALAAGANPVSVAEQSGHDLQVLLKTYAHVIERKAVFVDF